jgi:hypothetical protein
MYSKKTHAKGAEKRAGVIPHLLEMKQNTKPKNPK